MSKYKNTINVHLPIYKERPHRIKESGKTKIAFTSSQSYQFMFILTLTGLEFILEN